MMIQLADQEKRVTAVRTAPPKEESRMEPELPRVYLFGKPPAGWVEDFYTQHGTAD